MTKQFGTPGPRAIYPELCDSPSLGRCSILANALFPRLIARADDQGRLIGAAHDVLVECMPKLLRQVTVDGVQTALEELEAAGMVQVYAAGGEVYLQLVQWWRWQQSQRRAYPSRWPAPPGWRDLVFGVGPEGAETFAAAARGASPRNAAIRGIAPQIAADCRSRDTGARRPARRRLRAPGAVPDHANAVPSGAHAPGAANGAAPGGGMAESWRRLADDPSQPEQLRAEARSALQRMEAKP